MAVSSPPWLLSSHTMPSCQAEQPLIPMNTWCFFCSISLCILFLLKKMFFLSTISMCLYPNCPEKFNSNVKILWRISWFLIWTWFFFLIVGDPHIFHLCLLLFESTSTIISFLNARDLLHETLVFLLPSHHLSLLVNYIQASCICQNLGRTVAHIEPK